jgi:hypothetical protein
MGQVDNRTRYLGDGAGIVGHLIASVTFVNCDAPE